MHLEESHLAQWRQCCQALAPEDVALCALQVDTFVIRAQFARQEDPHEVALAHAVMETCHALLARYAGLDEVCRAEVIGLVRFFTGSGGGGDALTGGRSLAVDAALAQQVLARCGG